LWLLVYRNLLLFLCYLLDPVDLSVLLDLLGHPAPVDLPDQ
jgi:hypothetical protein